MENILEFDIQFIKFTLKMRYLKSFVDILKILNTSISLEIVY
jgi:hypothetical protein